MVRRPLAYALLAIAAVFSAGAAPAAAATDASGRAGEVRFVKRMTPADDKYVTSGNTATQAWLNQKFWRTEVFAPFFDSRTSWYGKGWLYSDIYAVYNGSATARDHSDWIARDAAGNKLFIPWGCSNGTCPQYAADITNAAFRANWIAALKTNLAKGYKGAWIDDVNLELRVGNGYGQDVLPYSPALGRTMNAADWRKAMADFTEQIRAAVPSTFELLHNSIWYAGQGVGQWQNADVKRQIASADYINLERGVTDGGLTGGSGEWSLRAVQRYTDAVHALGKGLIVDSSEETDAKREYSLANYLLVSTGKDGVGDMSQSPDAWWKGWDTNLGDAASGRYDWQGLMRRDFTGGLALVNEPQAPTRTVVLPQAMVTTDGRTVTSVTLAAGQGAVLTGVGVKTENGSTPTAPTTPATPATTPTCTCAPTTPTTPTAPTTTTPKPTTPTTTTPAPTTCKTVRVFYPTIRWSSKLGKFVASTGSTKVCVPTALKAGTKAHRAAVKRATKAARKASLQKAKAQRLQAVRAEAARAAKA